MADWITQIVESLGYFGIALLMFLENVFPPIPSELIMPLGGFTVAQGGMSFGWLWFWGTVGSVAGQMPLYFLGHVVGLERLKTMCRRHRWLLVDAEDVTRASEWFDRHGGKAVLLCRLVPGLRSLISIPAGIRGMPILPFLVYSTLGMGVWAALLAWAGLLLGQNYERVGRYIGPVTYVVIFILTVAFLVWAIRKYRRKGVAVNE